MIVSSKGHSVGTKVQTLGRGSGGIYSQYASQLYRVPEAIARTYGKWNEYKKYIPSYYEEKYTYKPRKRLAGYVGQKIYKKKNGSYNKFYQKRRRSNCEYGNWSSKSFTCKSSQHTTFNKFK